MKWTVVILAVVAAVPGNEVLPEKFLKPRDFNYHPYTDVGVPAALKRQTIVSTPFAILAKLRPKETHDISERNLLYSAVPHASILPKKVEAHEIPKNYAFTYTVKDHLSGDDFSHSQAHNGKATKGQYRVKLPDGRTQIVSYTADHKGYRADVQYEDKIPDKPYPEIMFNSVQSAAQVAEHTGQAYQDYEGDYLTMFQYEPVSSAIAPTSVLQKKSEGVNYITVSPVHLDGANKRLKLLLNQHRVTAIVPEYKGKGTHLIKFAPPQYHQQFVSSTALPLYVSTTPTPEYISHISSTPLYRVEHVPTSDEKTSYQTNEVPSTTSSSHQGPTILVTPRPIYEQDASEKVQSVVYRVLKK